MGSELLADTQPIGKGGSNKTSTQIGYKDLILNQLPYYLSIGMTYNQYMKEDVDLVKYYRKANKLSNDRQNQMLWLQGIYIRDAIGTLLTKKIKYPNQPYPLSKEEYEVQQEKELKDRIDKAKQFLIKSSKKVG